MAIPRVSFTVNSANLANVRRVEHAVEDESGNRSLRAVQQLTVNRLDQADKSKLSTAPETVLVGAGQVFVTVQTDKGTQLGLVNGKEFAAAQKAARTGAPVADVKIELVSDALAEASVALLHSVDNLDATTSAISE